MTRTLDTFSQNTDFSKTPKNTKITVFPVFYPERITSVFESAANCQIFLSFVKTVTNQDAHQSDMTRLTELDTAIDTLSGNTF